MKKNRVNFFVTLPPKIGEKQFISKISDNIFAGLGIRSSVFCANCSFFAKNERMSASHKKRAICSFLVSDLSDSRMVPNFCENRSWSLILVSDLSDSLTLLIKKEGMSELLIF